jgi:ABC-type uncharacterized transport system substrate-binding protein
MRRRDFITMLGGAAAWPPAVYAQQPPVPVIGFVHVGSAKALGHLVTGFRQGLKETGYIEGQNVAIELRWADGQTSRLPEMVADLLRRHVAVLVTGGGEAPVEQLDDAFAAIVKEKPDALLILADRVFLHNRKRMMEFATQQRLPSVNAYRELVEAGGLMSYGPSYEDLHRHAAVYVDKILKGAKPADLPVEQPTKFELVINLKTAKALGLTIPTALLVAATGVIE